MARKPKKAARPSDETRPKIRDAYARSLAIRVREIVRALGVKDKEIAEHAGMTPQWISKRLTFETKISSRDVMLIARALGISSDTLLDIAAEVPSAEELHLEQLLLSEIGRLGSKRACADLMQDQGPPK